jgi:mannosyltransferase
MILIVAAFLRIYHLDFESLWIDEVTSASFANEEDSWGIIIRSQTDPNFPTYYLILHYWAMLFGASEFSLRFPSALAGVLAVLAMYKVGRLLFGYGTGLVAALILAFSPFHIFYSQETRVYELMALFGLLSFYFFLKVLRERTLTSQVGYVLCTSVLMYSHVYGLFTLLAQNLYVLLAKSRDHHWLGRWAVLQTFLFALYMPGIWLVYRWLSDPIARNANSWIVPPSLDSIYADLVRFSGSPLLVVLFLTLALVGLVRSDFDKLCLLLMWLLTPLALPIAISIFFTPIFVDRHAIVATLALYLLVAKGVEVASNAFSRTFPERKALTMGLIAAALIVLSSERIWAYYDTVNKKQWREAVQYLNTNVQPHDLILVYPSWSQPALDYYFERSDVETEPVPHTDMMTDPVPSILENIKEHDRVWVVRDLDYQPDQTSPDAFFEEPPTHHERYMGLDLSLYDKKSTQD